VRKHLNEDFKPNVQERLLKALLDLVILQMLEHQPMSAYQIDKSILRKFGDRMSPTVVYTKLSAMEAENMVKCVRSSHGRVYSLIEKGRKMAGDMPSIINEIQKVALTLRVN
jgi:DNA-binding PadR family transcriptional regulator